MKKSLIIAGLLAFLATTTASYADTVKNLTQTKAPAHKERIKNQRPERPNLDERLKLTEEQKTKAHDIRMKGHEKIKPIMEKIKSKHQEIGKILEDKTLSQEQKDRKLDSIEKELLNLKQQARRIRTENMKQFEAILTAEQKAELEKIKEEGRAMRGKMPKGPHDGRGPHRPMPQDPMGPHPIEK